MSTGDRNNFGPEHAKVTTSTSTDRARLTAFLRGLISLDFSEKGRANICQRFAVSADELDTAIAALRRPRPSAPAAELLYAIGTAVSCTSKAKGGAAKW